jgi:hypothetical protein
MRSKFGGLKYKPYICGAKIRIRSFPLLVLGYVWARLVVI